LIEVSSQDVGGIVYSVPCPVQSLAIAVGGIERNLELLDALLATRETKDALDIGRCLTSESVKMWMNQYLATFFFEEYTTFCNYDRHVAVDVALAFIVEE
jgi:hypothetical protein